MLMDLGSLLQALIPSWNSAYLLLGFFAYLAIAGSIVLGKLVPGVVLANGTRLHITAMCYNGNIFLLFTSWYFLAEIEGLEQKSDSEVEEGLLMLLDSDLSALKVDFLELQNSKWCASNCVGK
ncbi:Delta(14)-sterol reductase [Arachis hypogaea]|nr:Delta(14)-sterol reductase [Arachis hypogaea]